MVQRWQIPPRPHWQEAAESVGFDFHTLYGAPYWDESVCYAFTLRQIEDHIEDPTAELEALCQELVSRAVRDERLLERMAIPPQYWDWIAGRWFDGDPSLYGRFDLVYDGRLPARLLEYNADTPTAVFETGYFQWWWLTEVLESGTVPAGSDQFNSLQDQLIDTFAAMKPEGVLHFACCTGSAEDRGTVDYLRDCANQAGWRTSFLYVEDIALDAQGRFCQPDILPTSAGAAVVLDGIPDATVIDRLFKLYPWEWMFADPYGAALTECDTAFLEPPWKALLSNKAILPLLWEMAPGHPNLLPAYFEGDPRISDLERGVVRKPLFSREGANVTIARPGHPPVRVDGPYGREGFVVQQYQPLPATEGNHMVVGSWIVAGVPAGMGLREDRNPITEDLSRFVPHIILPE